MDSCFRVKHGTAAMRTSFRMGLAFALVWANLLLARALYAQESVRFAVTDIVGLEELHTEYGAFQKVLSAATGLDIRFFPVSNRTAAVEALKSRKIDLVLTGPAEYIIFQTRTNAYPIIGFSRPDYFAALVTMAEWHHWCQGSQAQESRFRRRRLDVQTSRAHATSEGRWTRSSKGYPGATCRHQCGLGSAETRRRRCLRHDLQQLSRAA